MEVFLIDEGGCREWIVAESIDDAKAVLLENRCMSPAPTWEKFLEDNYQTDGDYEISQLARDTELPIIDGDTRGHPVVNKTVEAWLEGAERGTLCSTEF